jgi:hypothetical protein
MYVMIVGRASFGAPGGEILRLSTSNIGNLASAESQGV